MIMTVVVSVMMATVCMTMIKSKDTNQVDNKAEKTHNQQSMCIHFRWMDQALYGFGNNRE
jgi:hypothetical protein